MLIILHLKKLSPDWIGTIIVDSIVNYSRFHETLTATITKLVGNLGTRRRGSQVDYEHANQIPNVIMKLRTKFATFRILVRNLQV